ncbi:MAG TPA: hypothetical protein VG125_06765 [Pirellulales bacterium]|jgi:hypothetical protein|nr:hypothetical protein [Pirellulales bacterium]
MMRVMPGSDSGDERRREQANVSWSPGVRLLVSGVLVWHLIGLLVGPISSPPSILGERLQSVYSPYLAAAYLNHGYKFFGPDPGPSHLVRYVVEMADGERIEGAFPDRKVHWPRLLYHRHFMLSEYVVGLAGPWDPRFDWDRQPLSPPQEAYIESYAHHLLAKYAAKRVTLYLVEHRLATPQEVVDGMQLDDSRLYRSRKLGSFES